MAGIERDRIEAGPCAAHGIRLEAGLGRQGEQSTFHRIADHGPAAVGVAELGVVAQEAGQDQRFACGNQVGSILIGRPATAPPAHSPSR